MNVVGVLYLQFVLIMCLPAILSLDKWLYQQTKRDAFKNYVPASILETIMFSAGLWCGWILGVF